MPETTLGSDAIKLACVQAIPGSEREIVSKFEAHLSGQKEKIAFLKGFGSFDIITIYSTPSFDYFLSNAGPVKGILKSNLFLCFPHFGSSSAEIISSISASRFSLFCFLKVDPKSHHLLPKLEMHLVNFFKENDVDGLTVHVLGTLGWTELIVVVSGDKPDDLFRKLHRLMAIGINYKSKSYSILLKTFSIFSLNYDSIPEEKVLRDWNKTYSLFDKDSCFKTSKVPFKPNIMVSGKPGNMPDIVKYWADKNFKINRSLGVSDVVATYDKKLSWPYFLASLLNFRCKFRDSILSTSTSIISDPVEYMASPMQTASPRFSGKTSYATQTLKNLFGANWGSQLANDFYSLTQLATNPIVGDSFRDMVRYPRFLVKMRKDSLAASASMPFLDTGIEAYVSNASKALSLGAELRTYGIYGTVEEVSGRFSRLRGGAQRAVLASEFLVTSVLRYRLDTHWDGFIISDGNKFLHNGCVLNVPPKSLLSPLTWWALYHEIGHIYSHFHPRLMVNDAERFRDFLQGGDDPDHRRKIASELIAEIIGFELGFFDNYELFNKKLWQHLAELGQIVTSDVPLDFYVVRTFYVYMYYQTFKKKAIGSRKWKDTDFLFEKLCEHIESIEKSTTIKFNDKYFLAARCIHAITELYDLTLFWLTELNRAGDFFPDRRMLNDENTLRVCEKLKAGQVYSNKVHHPESILYNLILEDNASFRQDMAVIITFWKQQVSKLYAK